MSFRYTSDVEIGELQTKPRPLSGSETLLVVQDERTYKCSITELLSDLQIQTTPLLTPWGRLTDLPLFSGNTNFSATTERATQTLDIPEHQFFHFVDVTFTSGSLANVLVPAKSSQIDYSGVRVLVRANMPVNSTLYVREEFSDAVPLATGSALDQGFIWVAMFVNNGTVWKWVPIPSDALTIG